MYLEPLSELNWAYQLHYYLCFRTRYRLPFSDADQLNLSLAEVCRRHDYHLLRSKFYSNHVRCLLSLKPQDSISAVVRTLKANSSPRAGFWQTGYLAKTIGRVRIGSVRQYIEDQSQHHGYATRLLPPVFRYRAEKKIDLDTAHASFDLSYHFVFATRYRIGIFNASLGERLADYWLRVASLRGFAIDRLTVVPDHMHLLIRTAPKMSVEECVLSLLNNGQYFVGKYAPQILVQAGVDRLWQASAYAGSTGEMTTALLKKFLS